MSSQNEGKQKIYSVSVHFLMPVNLRERLDVLAAESGKKVSELILEAVVKTYFSGTPATIEPPAKGE